MANITKPPILDETGQAIVTALGNVSIRPQIVDNLTTADANKALSANMGNSLKTNIDGLSDVIMTMGNTLSSNVNAIKPSLGMNNTVYNDLQNTTDANTVNKTCVLYAYNCSNLPSGVSSYGYLTTLYANSNYIKQIYTPSNEDQTFERLKINGTWGSWNYANVNCTICEQIQNNIISTGSGRNWGFPINTNLSNYKFVLFSLQVYSESSSNSICIPVGFLNTWPNNIYLITVRGVDTGGNLLAWCGISDIRWNYVGGWVNNPELNVTVLTYGIK